MATEKITGKELSRRYPHVRNKYNNAALQGAINRSKIPGDRHYLYHLDETFERWQAKYLEPSAHGAQPRQVAGAPMGGHPPVPPVLVALAGALRSVEARHRSFIDSIYALDERAEEAARDALRAALDCAATEVEAVDHFLGAIARSAGMKRLDANRTEVGPLLPSGDGALDDVPREEDFETT